MDDPELRIELERLNGQIWLTIRDNGPGLPAGFDWRESRGFGMTLIQTLADQLPARVAVENRQGVVWSITFDQE